MADDDIGRVGARRIDLAAAKAQAERDGAVVARVDVVVDVVPAEGRRRPAHHGPGTFGGDAPALGRLGHEPAQFGLGIALGLVDSDLAQILARRPVVDREGTEAHQRPLAHFGSEDAPGLLVGEWPAFPFRPVGGEEGQAMGEILIPRHAQTQALGLKDRRNGVLDMLRAGDHAQRSPEARIFVRKFGGGGEFSQENSWERKAGLISSSSALKVLPAGSGRAACPSAACRTCPRACPWRFLPAVPVTSSTGPACHPCRAWT